MAVPFSAGEIGPAARRRNRGGDGLALPTGPPRGAGVSAPSASLSISELRPAPGFRAGASGETRPLTVGRAARARRLCDRGAASPAF